MAPALKMKRLGSELNHPMAVASGCQGLGMAQFILGNFLDARNELEFGLKANDGQISGVHCYPSMSQSYLAWTLLVLGDRSAAEVYADRAIESASRESSHAVATALSNCCYVYQCMGAIGKVYDRISELEEHTKKFGEHMYLKRATIIRCWADCMLGKGDQPIEIMASEIDYLLSAGEEVESTFLLGLLADLQIREQRVLDAHATLNRALDIANKNDEKFYLSELYRLKGVLAQTDPERFSSAYGPDYLVLAERTAEEQRAQAWLERLQRHHLDAAS
jgi:tetratricopeptide (TPR) repeat protein